MSRFCHDLIHGVTPQARYVYSPSQPSFCSSSNIFLLLATLLSVPTVFLRTSSFLTFSRERFLPFMDYFVFLIGYTQRSSKDGISTCCFCSKLINKLASTLCPTRKPRQSYDFRHGTWSRSCSERFDDWGFFGPQCSEYFLNVLSQVDGSKTSGSHLLLAHRLNVICRSVTTCHFVAVMTR